MTDNKLIEDYITSKNYKELYTYCRDYTYLLEMLSSFLPLDEFKYTNPINIKLLGYWASPKTLRENIKHLGKEPYKWNNINIVDEGENIDYYVIFESTIEPFIPSKAILFSQDPIHRKKLDDEWKNVEKNFLKIIYEETYNNFGWSLNRTYLQLKTDIIYKTKDNRLSILMNNDYNTSRMVKKRDFVKLLEKHNYSVDIYGDNKYEYKNYVECEGDIVDNALLPYKYTFDIEDYSRKNYITESVINGILAECLVFYNGCINYKEIIDENAIIYIPFSNLQGDYELIKYYIDKDIYNERLPYIKKAKQQILDKLQFFPRLEDMIEQLSKN